MLHRMIRLGALLTGSYALLGLLFGTLNLWSEGGITLLSGRSAKIAACLALALSALLFYRRDYKQASDRLALNLSLGIFILVLVSDVVARPFGFYNNGELARVDLLYIGALIGALLYGSRYVTGQSWSVRALPLLLLQILLTLSFFQLAAGRLLWSDDHPSFLYRLEQLRNNFPDIPFYYPGWNLGYQAREFFATGVLNVFLLSFPVLYLVQNITVPEDAAFYSYLIPYLFVWVVPWSIYLAARVLRQSVTVATLAGIFALAPSTMIFEWALKYGTLAFVLSAGLFPLTLALCFRLAIDELVPKTKHAIALLVTASLSLMWTLTSLALVPILFLAFLRPRQLFAPVRRSRILLFAILFILLNGPWILIFLRESQVVDFVAQSKLPGAGESVASTASVAVESRSQQLTESITRILTKGVNRFREGIARTNPFVLFLGLGGLALVRDKKLRLVISTTVFALAIAALIGDPLKPQLELRRLLLHASYLLCIPAAMAAHQLLASITTVLSGGFRINQVLLVVLQVVILGAIGETPLTANAAYLNRSSERFAFAPPLVGNLARAIREHGGDGVTFFAGFILHELGATSNMAQDGGHVGPLSIFTGKHLYASDFMHRRWSSIDPIPKVYRDRGSAGIEEFLDLVNATAVVTFTRPWAQYCKDHDRYEEIFHEGSFRLFRRSGGPESFFYRGKGELLSVGSELSIKPLDEEVILRFRYLPGIVTSKPGEVKLYPVPVFEEDQGEHTRATVSYIGLKISRSFLETGQALHIGYFAEGAVGEGEP